MEQLPRVIFYRPQINSSQGGAVQVLKDLLPHLRNDEFSAMLVCPSFEEGFRHEFLGDAVEFYPFFATSKLRRALRFLGLWGYVVALRLKSLNPDVIFVSGRPDLYLLPKSLRRLGWRRPIVVRVGTVLSMQVSNGEKEYLDLVEGFRQVDKIIVPSELVANDIIDNFGVLQDRVEVIYNSCRPLSSSRSQSDFKCPTFLFLGSLSDRKDPETALRAFALALSDKMIPAGSRLWVVGDGPCRSSLVKLAEELGQSETVVFWGFQSEVSRFYEEADVYVHPSKMDGFSFGLIEAVQAKLPIAYADSPVGALPLLKRHSVGNSFEAGDPSSLANLMSQIVAENGAISGDYDSVLQEVQPENFVRRYSEVLMCLAKGVNSDRINSAVSRSIEND